MNIRPKLTLAMLITSIVGTLLISFAAASLIRSSQIEARGEALRAIVHGQKNNVLHIVEAWEESARLISSRTRLRTLLAEFIENADDKLIPQMELILADAMASSSNAVFSIGVCSPQGERILFVGDTDKSGGDCPIYEDVSKNVFSVDKLWSTDGVNINSLLTGPISQNAIPIGTLTLTIDAAQILRITESASGLGLSGETVLAEKDASGEARFLSALLFSTDILSQTVSMNRSNVPMVQALQGREITMTSEDTIDYSGRTILAATAYIPELGWGLVSKMDRGEALAPVEALLWTIAQAAFLAFTVGLLAAVSLARSISAPILHIAQVAKKVKMGDLTLKARVDTRDEVGELAEAFNDMLENLQERSDELEQFNYRTAHDLRSPLRSTMGLIPMIEEAVRSKKSSAALQALDLCDQSLQKLDTLLDDIALLAKTDHLKELSVPMDVAEIVDRAIQSLDHIENYDRILFRTDFSHTQPIRSQPKRFRRIVESLVSNAIKYQDLREEQSFVLVSTSEFNGDFVISVEDNGLGVPESLRTKLFVMFERLHPRTSFGSGLGLYMVKKSVQHLGGEISHEATHSGSRFRVALPRSDR